MAAIDYKTEEIDTGQFDIVLPLTKIFTQEDMLFQQVQLILNTYTKEFLYDITMGMPYDSMLDKKFDVTETEGIYYEKISVLIYFKDMHSFVMDIDQDRNYLISFTVVSQNDVSQEFSFVL